MVDSVLGESLPSLLERTRRGGCDVRGCETAHSAATTYIALSRCMRRIPRPLRRVADALLWALLPGHCLMCDQASERRADLCDACSDALPWIDRACVRCALPSDASYCADCQRRPPPFERAIAPLEYADATIAMVHRLKFGGSRIDARVLGTLLAARVRTAYADAPLPDVIVPVPLGRARLLRRGHNQAALLARWVGAALAVPIDYVSCARIRHTTPQAGLSRAARLHNLAGAFEVVGSFAERRVGIVDDVMTTGSTVAAVARALRVAGAASIDVWCAARTVPASHSDVRARGIDHRDC